MYGGVSKPPFRAVIPEYPWWQPFHNATITSIQYRDLLAISACNNLACLRQLPGDKLANAAQMTYTTGYNGAPSVHGQVYGYGDFYYGPSVDGKIIRDLPSVELAAGHFSKVPLMTNRETYEGYLFNNPLILTTQQVESDIRALWPQASPQFFTQLFNLYPVADYALAFNRTSAIFADGFINCGTWQISEAFTKAGLPVWKQIFNAGNQKHAATMPFLFEENANGTVTPVANETLSKAMKDWFISFATDLDPNKRSFSGAAKPYWPVYGCNGTVLEVNSSSIVVRDDPDDSVRCEFLKRNGMAILN